TEASEPGVRATPRPPRTGPEIPAEEGVSNEANGFPHTLGRIRGGPVLPVHQISRAERCRAQAPVMTHVGVDAALEDGGPVGRRVADLRETPLAVNRCREVSAPGEEQLIAETASDRKADDD